MASSSERGARSSDPAINACASRSTKVSGPSRCKVLYDDHDDMPRGRPGIAPSRWTLSRTSCSSASWSPAAIAPTMAGVWLGQHARRRLSPETFRKAFIFGMFAVGLHMATALL